MELRVSTVHLDAGHYRSAVCRTQPELIDSIGFTSTRTRVGRNSKDEKGKVAVHRQPAGAARKKQTPTVTPTAGRRKPPRPSWRRRARPTDYAYGSSDENCAVKVLKGLKLSLLHIGSTGVPQRSPIANPLETTKPNLRK